jgi:NhaP-type Na+/H+ or K+/H+ antiporter
VHHITLSVVALSILLHGISTQPLLARYEQRQKRKTDFSGGIILGNPSKFF